MAWWKPLVLVVVMSLVMLALQILSYLLVGVIEGSDDPSWRPSTSPWWCWSGCASGGPGT